MSDRLAELEDENAALRRLQTLQRQDERVGRLIAAGLRPKLARVALIFHDRGPGKVVGNAFIIEAFDLLGAAEPMGTKDVSVWIYKLRQAFGADAVQSVRTVGYRLTPAGAAKIAALLA